VFFHPDDFDAMDALRKRKPKESTQRYVKINQFIFTYESVSILLVVVFHLFVAKRNQFLFATTTRFRKPTAKMKRRRKAVLH
jgi:hypothetical protein